VRIYLLMHSAQAKAGELRCQLHNVSVQVYFQFRSSATLLEIAQIAQARAHLGGRPLHISLVGIGSKAWLIPRLG